MASLGLADGVGSDEMTRALVDGDTLDTTREQQIVAKEGVTIKLTKRGAEDDWRGATDAAVKQKQTKERG
jgi:hypothetical protein